MYPVHNINIYNVFNFFYTLSSVQKQVSTFSNWKKRFG